MNNKIEQLISVIKWLLIIWFGIIPILMIILFLIGFLSGVTESI